MNKWLVSFMLSRTTNTSFGHINEFLLAPHLGDADLLSFSELWPWISFLDLVDEAVIENVEV